MFSAGDLGLFFVYWAQANGYQTLILKKYHEQIAIGLMGAATVLFLMRAVFCRMEIDYILSSKKSFHFGVFLYKMSGFNSRVPLS